MKLSNRSGVEHDLARNYEKRKKLQAASVKLQAALTMDHGYNRINLESEEIYMSMDSENYQTVQLKRIADAIEEILRIVKKDMEPKKK